MSQLELPFFTDATPVSPATVICDDVLAWAEKYTGPKFMAMICDPPYHLTEITGMQRHGSKRFGEPRTDAEKAYRKTGARGFMGNEWDGGDIAFRPDTWKALAQHLLPGAFGMCFASSRGWHRLACAIEDAGLIIHPSIFGWGFGSGFPKASRIDVDRAEDYKLKAQVRRAAVEAVEMAGLKLPGNSRWDWTVGEHAPGNKWWAEFLQWIPTLSDDVRDHIEGHIVATIQKAAGWFTSKDIYEVRAPATPLAKVWEQHRYGLQALKPSLEPIIVFQKPYQGKPVESITQTGAGSLWIEGARIAASDFTPHDRVGAAKLMEDRPWQARQAEKGRPRIVEGHNLGRWPANFALSHLSLPVLRLKGHLSHDTLEAIRRYYHGYTGVSAMRGRKGHDAVQAECGPEVLQSQMQERIIPDQSNTEENRTSLSPMWEDISCTDGVDSGGAPKVLQSNMSGQVSQNTDWREESSLGKEAQQRVTGQDFTNARRTRACVTYDGTESSPMEGWHTGQARLPVCHDQIIDRRAASNGSFDASERKLYSRASISASHETRSTVSQERDCTPPQWEEGRQQTRESRIVDEQQTFADSSENREGIISVESGQSETPKREWPLEVLARDVPDGWLDYFELTGEDLGCVRVGTRQVKNGSGSVSGHEPSNATLNVYGEYGRKAFDRHADANGNETVDAWDCAPGCVVHSLDQQAGERPGGSYRVNAEEQIYTGVHEGYQRKNRSNLTHKIPGQVRNFGDAGGASRFFFTADWSLDIAERLAQADPVFYCAKSSRSERDAGLEGLPLQSRHTLTGDTRPSRADRQRRNDHQPAQPSHNIHPTVKALKLTQWLATLLLPPDAYAPRRILNCFSGSGSEAIGAMLAGWEEIVMIEQDASYCEIAEARLKYWAQHRDHKR